MRRAPVPDLAWALALVLTLATAGNALAAPPDPAPLHPLDERTLGIGESHDYYFPMKKGEYLRIDVEQNDDIDAGIRLFDSEGRLLFHANSYTDTHGAETLSWIAERTEVLGVQVYVWGDRWGKYAATFDGPRHPSSYDLRRTHAFKALFEGIRLEDLQPKSLRWLARDRYRSAILEWERLAEPRWTAMATRHLARLLYDDGQRLEAGRLFRNSWPQLLKSEDALFIVEAALIVSRSLAHGPSTADCTNYFTTAVHFLPAINPEFELGYARELAEIAETIGHLGFAAIFARQEVGAARALRSREQLLQGLASLSRILRRLGRIDESGRAASTLSRFAQSPEERVQAAIALAMAFVVGERPEQAIEVLEPALGLDLSSDRRADLHQYLGRAYYEAGNFRAASRYFEMAASVHVTSPLLIDFGFLALSEIRQGHIPSARRALQRADETPIERNSDENAFLYRVSAEISRSEGRWDEALKDLSEALGELTRQRNRTVGAALGASYWATKVPYLELSMELQIEIEQVRPGQGHLSSAFLALEAGRAPVLINQLSAPQDRVRSLTEETSLALRSIDDRLIELQTRRPPDWRRQEDNLSRQRAEINLDSRLADALRVESFRPADPLQFSLAELRAQLGPEDSFLSFHLGRDRSYVWLLSRKELRVEVLPPRRAIDSLVKETLEALRNSRQPDNPKRLDDVVDRLSATILGPLRQLPPGRRLLLSLDGSLHRIPFAILSDPRNPTKTLLDRVELAVIPSLTALLLSRKIPRQCEGAAVVGGVNSEISTEVDRESVLELDPGAIVATSGRSDLFSGRLNNLCLLHFATHGTSDDLWPDTAALILKPPAAIGEAPSERLYAFEIEALSLSPGLVVLAACESGRGDFRGEGLYGLPRAFLASGTRAVLASLWSIDGRASGELMTSFYRRLAAGETAAAALRGSQLEMRSRPNRSLPLFWAGFQLVGDPGVTY